MFALVAVPLPLPLLTYRIPEGMNLAPGDAVKVMVRRKTFDGIIFQILNDLPEKPSYEIRALSGTSEDFPRLSEETINLIQWAADYYHYPHGEVLRTMLPPDPAPKKRARYRTTPSAEAQITLGNWPKGKAQRAVLEKMAGAREFLPETKERPALRKLLELGLVEEFTVNDDQQPAVPPPTSIALSLTAKQAEAVQKISAAIDEKKFSTFLLQGVTGSGKTEVYLRAADHALRAGKSVLVVVPEIALTPQLVGRFRSRLGEGIALLHSGISDGERSRHWHQVNRGLYRVCIGARSAALAPMQNVGLIIVDEEHDSALKQEDHLKYNARDLSIVRGKHSSATVILGSATPSLESYHNCQTGRYKHILLTERPTGQPMPMVHVVDRSKTDQKLQISPHLKMAITSALERKEQVMLLLNRRGFSSFLICESCGFVPECPNCSVSLTNYRSARNLKCHYCGYAEEASSSCQKCGSEEIVPGTLGTESLEEEVREMFPAARALRIDRESVERKGSLERALGQIANREVDIVIGTQIIAKGHDFPNISLVGVVNADSSFHLPDFRASEKSFQLFTQMAGRAGRGDIPGKVILQTYNPNHPSIVHATKHDFRSFAEEELRFRHEFSYPPYVRLVRLLVTAGSSAEAEAAAERLMATLSKVTLSPAVEIIGPAPAVLSKVQNKFRWNLLLKCIQPGPLHTLIDVAFANAPKVLSNKASLQVDVDPVSLM